MKISVIVPFLNEQKYIATCINSLLNQNFPSKEYELIFIDNNSTDNSYKIAKSLLRPQDKLLKEKTPNVYAARNTGLKHAKGEILAFTDADCLVDKSWLTQIHQTLNNSQNRLLLGKRLFPHPNIFLKAFQDYENQKVAFTTTHLSPQFQFGFTNNMALKKQFNPKTYFNTNHQHSDSDLVSQFAQSKQIISYNPHMIITHLEITATSAWLKKLFLYGQNNYSLSQSSPYKNLKLLHNFQISQATSSANKYTTFEIISLYTSLFLGLLSYKSGELLQKLKSQ